MIGLWPFLVYGCAFCIAVALLYFFRTPWYWHVLAVIAAIFLGLIPNLRDRGFPDLLVGFVFFLLLVWGIGAPFFARRHHSTASRMAAGGQ